ncbi:kelch-like protein 26 [Hippocampus comes]|uniref:kelch-like protein 26 n=1 Tax=Hippocampus comes TaxID=109280 RepID=UPI00094EAD06|nr:PREDICTED: kelch-like protein 26 [Hippocampus comes]
MASEESTLCCTFSAPCHSAILLQGLSILRAQGQLLDVVLAINEERFQVHKAVLAACSDYFRAMFTCGMKESNQNTIELEGLSARGLKHIIDFAYSSEVTLDLDCIQDVLGAAAFLQMVPVVEFCEEFLHSAMSVKTCLHIDQMATTFSLSSLKASVDAFTFCHFLQIAAEEDFLHIPVERLVFLLQSNKLKNCREIDLFHAAIRWLRHDESRRTQASNVLCHVRFPLMRSSELVDSVQRVDIMVEDVQCRQYLMEAFNYQSLPFGEHEIPSPRTLIRSDATSFITFGGTLDIPFRGKACTKVYYLPDSASRQFQQLTEMDTGCSHACVAVLDNFVYVVGGMYSNEQGAVNSCMRFDPNLIRWLRIQPMQEARFLFLLSVLNGKLYAAGGRNRSGSLSSVECYCPKKNKWTYVEPLKDRIWGHAGTPFGEKLYISGGYGVSLDVMKTLRCYDPVADQWNFRAPMNEPRVLHAMICSRDRVYALGGFVKRVGDCFDVLTVEHYDPQSDQWTIVSPMRTGQTAAGYCLLNGKIYLVGGYNLYQNKVTSIVQVYNTETDKWEGHLQFPKSVFGIACTPIALL